MRKRSEVASVPVARRRWAVAAAASVVGGAFALYWFAPWNLVVDRRVDEAVPTAATERPGATGEPSVAAPGEADPLEPAEEAERLALARGGFRSLEHPTTGSAVVLALADGRRFLRLGGLDTSNGPDLRVVLTDQPLSDDWHVWDDGELVDLGPLRGNVGSSNYELPEDLDLEAFETAVIWCRRFSVGFGVAPLDPV